MCMKYSSRGKKRAGMRRARGSYDSTRTGGGAVELCAADDVLTPARCAITMPRRFLPTVLALCAALATAAQPAHAGAGTYRPGQVVVQYAPGTSAARQDAIQRGAGARPGPEAG